MHKTEMVFAIIVALFCCGMVGFLFIAVGVLSQSDILVKATFILIGIIIFFSIYVGLEKLKNIKYG
jgi:hypothetical protein